MQADKRSSPPRELSARRDGPQRSVHKACDPAPSRAALQGPVQGLVVIAGLHTALQTACGPTAGAAGANAAAGRAAAGASACAAATDTVAGAAASAPHLLMTDASLASHLARLLELLLEPVHLVLVVAECDVAEAVSEAGLGRAQAAGRRVVGASHRAARAECHVLAADGPRLGGHALWQPQWQPLRPLPSIMRRGGLSCRWRAALLNWVRGPPTDDRSPGPVCQLPASCRLARRGQGPAYSPGRPGPQPAPAPRRTQAPPARPHAGLTPAPPRWRAQRRSR